MVHNTYITARPKVRKEKEPFYITEEKRTKTVLTLIQVRGIISDFEIKRIMKFGPGVHERTMRLIKNNYSDCVSWDKKTRLFKYIGKITIPSLEQEVNK